jgi:hypothetical protein
MSSKISHSIKHRTNPKDVFITPKPLAKLAIDMVQDSLEYELGTIDGKLVETIVWYDPFKNSGSYYNQFPEPNGCEHQWSEILEGRDFFKFNGRCDVICSNPPYSMLDKVFKKCIDLNPMIINLLIGVGNLTARRIEWMEKAGYGLTKLHMCKVYKWYGMSYIVQFEKGHKGIMSYDRKVWREEKKEEKKDLKK